MSSLGYQNSDDTKRDVRDQTRLRWFGPNRDEVWKQLAAELGARYDHSFWKGGRVTADVGCWQVVLDLFRTDKVVFTRIRAPFVNADGLRFKIHRRHLFSGVAELLGFHDITVGDSQFDEDFVIRGNDEPRVRLLFANVKLRQLIAAQPKITFEVKDDDGFFGARFPEGVDELRFQVGGVIKDIDRLKLLYDLFAETLQTLCEIGSAYNRDPEVRL